MKAQVVVEGGNPEAGKGQRCTPSCLKATPPTQQAHTVVHMVIPWSWLVRFHLREAPAEKAVDAGMC